MKIVVVEDDKIAQIGIKKIFGAVDIDIELVMASNGVGMSIVKKIIDNYGGKIWFESEVGQGTTFKFNLPRSMRSATLV